MGRYILRFRGAPAAPDAHVQSIAAARGVKVIDKSPNMLLVDGDEAVLRKQLEGMPGWSLHTEQQIPLPDTRHKID
jgi:hypothetical protein